MEKIIINSRESVRTAKNLLSDNGFATEAAELDRWSRGRRGDDVLCEYETVSDLVALVRQWAKDNPKPRKTGTKKKSKKTKKSKKSEIVKLPTELADRNGWLAISEGVNLTGIDKQIFMAKVMQMFAEEMQSSEYSEMHGAEIEQVKKMQNEVNELTAKIQPTLIKIDQLKNEIRNIQKQWDKRTKFQSQVAEYTYILHNNSDSDSEKGSHV